MRRDHVCARDFQHQLQQVPHIQAENGTAVGGQIADLLQT